MALFSGMTPAAAPFHFEWANGGSDFGLFGSPDITGDTLGFTPSSFEAESLDGEPVDVCDTLVFDLIANEGYINRNTYQRKRQL